MEGSGIEGERRKSGVGEGGCRGRGAEQNELRDASPEHMYSSYRIQTKMSNQAERCEQYGDDASNDCHKAFHSACLSHHPPISPQVSIDRPNSVVRSSGDGDVADRDRDENRIGAGEAMGELGLFPSR